MKEKVHPYLRCTKMDFLETPSPSLRVGFPGHKVSYGEEKASFTKFFINLDSWKHSLE